MAELIFPPTESKHRVIEKTREFLAKNNLEIADQDTERPWGAFFVIDQSSIVSFIAKYFNELPEDEVFQYGENISPKILLVAPQQKLSWQYHHRRAELWKVVSGPIGVIESDNDRQGGVRLCQPGELITHGPEKRHRLVGLDSWGVVAEIWQHTDPANLSDEDDIIRLEDTYGRS